MAITTTEHMFTHELEDIYDAEHRFLKGQQEMLAEATDGMLKGLIETHMKQTQQHISNLEQVFESLGQQAKGATCDAAAGLVSEAQKVIKEAGSAGAEAIRDCLIGEAATKVEHYEIVSYRGLVADAEMLSKDSAAALLRENLAQEEHTARLLEQSAPQLRQKAAATGA